MISPSLIHNQRFLFPQTRGLLGFLEAPCKAGPPLEPLELKLGFAPIQLKAQGQGYEKGGL